MLKTYLAGTFCALKKDTVFSVINIAGLALGLAVCLLIALYTKDLSMLIGRIKSIYASTAEHAGQPFIYSSLTMTSMLCMRQTDARAACSLDLSFFL